MDNDDERNLALKLLAMTGHDFLINGFIAASQ